MPVDLKLEQDLEGVLTTPLPTVPWPHSSRLSREDRAAVDRWTRDVERLIARQADAIRELQQLAKARWSA